MRFERVDTVEALKNLNIDLKNKTGGTLKTKCPNCSHTRRYKQSEPCLSVNISEGLYNCHHCGWSGRAKQDSYNSGYIVPRHKPKIYKKPVIKEESKIIGDPSEKMYKWFEEERKINREIVDTHKVYYTKHWFPAGKGRPEGESSCIAFPYFRNGELVNVKYRDAHKRFISESGCESIPYGIDDIDPAQPVYWVEGEIDKLTFYQVGIKNCLSVPNGGSDSRLEWLSTFEDLFDQVNHFVFAGDNDETGRKLKEELIRRLGAEKCWFINWPEGCKDANEAFVKLGEERFIEILNEPVPVPVNGIFTVDDFWEELVDFYNNGSYPGELLPSTQLQELYRPRLGEFTIVTGIPGSGKGRVIDWICHHLTNNCDWPIAYFSPETFPLKKHASRLISLETKKPFTEGPTPRMTIEELYAGREWLRHKYQFLKPEEDCSLDHILELAKVAVKRWGTKGIVIDPWNELDHTRPGWQSLTEHVSVCLSKIRQFVRNYNVHIWLIAHPTKLRKLPDGDYEVPTPYDISDSANFRNKADNCIAVHRNLNPESNSLVVQFHVQKIRFEENGKLGVAELKFDKLTGHYYDFYSG